MLATIKGHILNHQHLQKRESVPNVFLALLHKNVQKGAIRHDSYLAHRVFLGNIYLEDNNFFLSFMAPVFK